MNQQIDIDFLLEALPDYSRAEILTVIEYMVERRVEPTVENVQHALEVDEIRRGLVRLGINVSDDGRRNQISPTADRRGRVVLTFKQVQKLIQMVEATL